MKNKFFLMGILAIALVLGLTVAGCEDESNDLGSENYKAGYLLTRVTNSGTTYSSYVVYWTSYTNDRHYSWQYNYEQNTSGTSYQQSSNETRDRIASQII
jgi:ABC-type Fe3+ transport system substrate-binding protein